MKTLPKELKKPTKMKMNFPLEVIDLIERNQAVIFSLHGQLYRIEPFDPYDYMVEVK